VLSPLRAPFGRRRNGNAWSSSDAPPVLGGVARASEPASADARIGPHASVPVGGRLHRASPTRRWSASRAGCLWRAVGGGLPGRSSARRPRAEIRKQSFRNLPPRRQTKGNPGRGCEQARHRAISRPGCLWRAFGGGLPGRLSACLDGCPVVCAGTQIPVSGLAEREAPGSGHRLPGAIAHAPHAR
jgi:hypothetical protein